MLSKMGAKIGALGNQGVALAVLLAALTGFAIGHKYQVSGRGIGKVIATKGGDLGR